MAETDVQAIIEENINNNEGCVEQYVKVAEIAEDMAVPIEVKPKAKSRKQSQSKSNCSGLPPPPPPQETEEKTKPTRKRNKKIDSSAVVETYAPLAQPQFYYLPQQWPQAAPNPYVHYQSNEQIAMYLQNQKMLKAQKNSNKSINHFLM